MNSTIAANYNLIGVADDGNVTLSGIGNLTGTTTSPLDAKLAPLAAQGGPTLTHALLPGSPCVDAGSNPALLATDQRGFARTVGAGTDIGAFEVQPPAKVSSVVIGVGTAQRSVVNQIKVTFDSPVFFTGSAASAFTLVRQSDSMAVTLAASEDSTDTIVTLTFAGGAVDGASLADGRYTLGILANQVGADGFDGNGDGVAGDDYNLVGTPANGLFRLFGDADGNGIVDATDFLAFRLAFLQPNTAFDFYNSGAVDAADFLQFRLRFLESI